MLNKEIFSSRAVSLLSTMFSKYVSCRSIIRHLKKRGLTLIPKQMFNKIQSQNQEELQLAVD